MNPPTLVRRTKIGGSKDGAALQELSLSKGLLWHVTVLLILCSMNPDLYPDFMAVALREAQLAFEKNEVPVGAVVVHENRVIGRGHNLTESLHDATAHAEMIALSAAFNSLGDWRLADCYLFSTLEPCIMCASASVLSRVNTIVYGARDPKFGGCGSILTIPTIEKLNHRCEIVGGVCEQEVSELMKTFFQQVRKNKSKVN